MHRQKNSLARKLGGKVMTMGPLVFRPDGVPALPEILPQAYEPCQWCKGEARWDNRWASRNDTLLFSFACSSCGNQTIAEYPPTGKPTLRRGRDKTS